MTDEKRTTTASDLAMLDEKLRIGFDRIRHEESKFAEHVSRLLMEWNEGNNAEESVQPLPRHDHRK